MAWRQDARFTALAHRKPAHPHSAEKYPAFKESRSDANLWKLNYAKNGELKMPDTVLNNHYVKFVVFHGGNRKTHQN